MEEIWAPVVGYEGLYEVSNLGNVKSIRRNKVMRPGEHNFGYKYVILCRDGHSKNILVHRLVANAFIPKVVGKQDVNHIDGNKANNAVTNLEWVSKSDNMYHAYRTGIRYVTDKQRGSGRPKTTGQLEASKTLTPAKLAALRDPSRYHNTEPAVEAKRKRVRCIQTGVCYPSMASADRAIGCSVGQVSNSIKSGKSIYGYNFELI